MSKIIVYTDGGARGNPGQAAIGVVIKTETGQIIAKIGRKIGIVTNNVAEYQAVITALIWLKENKEQLSTLTMKPFNLIQGEPFDPAQGKPACAGRQFSNLTIQFNIDSKLIVNQLNGFFKVKNGELRNFIYKVRELEQEINLPIFYNQIEREKNREADLLVNRTLDSS